MSLTLSEKVQLNVLRAINRGESGIAQAPDEDYLKALATIGYIELGWDTYLTDMGRSRLGTLTNDEWNP